VNILHETYNNGSSCECFDVVSVYHQNLFIISKLSNVLWKRRHKHKRYAVSIKSAIMHLTDRELRREFDLPEEVDPYDVVSNLMPDGFLRVEAPLKHRCAIQGQLTSDTAGSSSYQYSSQSTSNRMAGERHLEFPWTMVQGIGFRQKKHDIKIEAGTLLLKAELRVVCLFHIDAVLQEKSCLQNLPLRLTIHSCWGHVLVLRVKL